VAGAELQVFKKSYQKADETGVLRAVPEPAELRECQA